MSKRKSVRKVRTGQVHAPNSWVIVSALKVKEIRALRKRAAEDEYDAFEGGLDMLASHILDWNWIDDEDNPLPLPKDDPNVIDELTNDESEFLANLLMGQDEAEKN